MELDALIHEPKFWVATSFVIFMALFLKYLAPIIARGLDSRAAKITAELEQAKRLREEAEAVLASYKAKEAETLKEAEALLKHAREEADRLKQQAEVALKESVDRRVAQANEKIARAEADAINTIRTQIVETAISAVKVVVADHLESEGDDAALDSAIASIGRIVH